MQHDHLNHSTSNTPLEKHSSGYVHTVLPLGFGAYARGSPAVVRAVFRAWRPSVQARIAQPRHAIGKECGEHLLVLNSCRRAGAIEKKRGVLIDRACRTVVDRAWHSCKAGAELARASGFRPAGRLANAVTQRMRRGIGNA